MEYEAQPEQVRANPIAKSRGNPHSMSSPSALANPRAAPSLRARAYASFQQQVVQANIRPGQFISQRELMQLLGMPLGAVRELIPRLEAEGLLSTVPKRGLQVAHVELKLINNASSCAWCWSARPPSASAPQCPRPTSRPSRMRIAASCGGPARGRSMTRCSPAPPRWTGACTT